MSKPDSMDQILKTLLTPQRPPQRNAYFYGKLMDVAHFQMEQDYFNAKRWMLNRLTLGTGIMCGLQVRVRDEQLCVARGVAIDGLGREIIVPNEVCLDPWRLTGGCGQAESPLPRDQARQVELRLCYTECGADAQPVLAADCNTGELCEPGTIVEGYRLEVCLAGDPQPQEGPDWCAALQGKSGAGQDAAGDYRVVATIETGGAPLGVVVHPAGRGLVISQESPGRAWVIDVENSRVIHTFEDLPGTPAGVAVAHGGGPVYVTSDQGVVLLDVTSNPPARLDHFLPEANYGLCAAGFSGKVLFAINTQTKEIDRIEGGQVAAKITAGKGPTLIDITADDKLLVVYDSLDVRAAWVDTSTNLVVKDAATNLSIGSLATRALNAENTAFLGSNGKGLTFTVSGNFGPHTLGECDARSLDFTQDGSRLYAVNNNPDTGAHQIVIYSLGAALTEIARLEVGEDPRAVAVVPGRLRALVANRGADTVSVVDVDIDRRKALCEAGQSDCCLPDDSCLTLARIDLGADGKITKLETCVAPVVYSNAALFEMILCLAERVDQCCNNQPQPEPEEPEEPDEPDEPQSNRLQVASVQFLDASGRVVAVYDPTQELVLRGRRKASVLRVQFANQKVEPGSLITGSFGDDPEKFTFLVQYEQSNLPNKFLPGKLEVSADATQVDFIVHEEFKIFGKGDYLLTLFGDPNPAGGVIKGQGGEALDGEPGSLPSGDGQPGGRFEMKFRSEG